MHTAHFKNLIIFIFVSVYYVNLSFSSSAKIEAITTPRQWKNTLNFISRIKPRGLPRECSAPPVFLIQFDVCRLGNKGIAPTNVNITW